MLRIAIIGYGTAGQAAAIALGRSGRHAIEIFEQTAEAGPIGAGFLLQPTGLAALARLKLLDQALQLGAPISRLHGCNARGRRVMNMRYAAWRSDAFGLGMQRHALFSMLHDALPTSVNLRTGIQIRKLDPASGFIHDDVGTQYGTYDLIIVADGSRSQMRTQVFGDSSARLYPWGAWWCLVSAKDWPQHDSLEQRYRLAREMVGVLPVGRLPGQADVDDKLCVYWSVRSDEAPQGHNSHDIASKVAPLWPQAADHLRQQTAAELTHATYRAIRMPRWTQQRAVWIGDSAHGMSPQLGQGANLALLDALALADAIDAQPDLATALKQYEKVRRTHVRWYSLGSHWLTPLFQSEHDTVARLRDLFFDPLSRLPIIRQISLQLLTGSLGA
ncbi:MAG TPA: NAD(P)/FAD-dependent oxidoreductase [Rhodocyclaceae bacterium]|nr:NAD(P)/FAD-dependent oxidoreductase [Rhodocyclaceae bacterium]